jgi:pSer/pThr/pTyr-binding forkhead associated (FHA) protein
MVRSTAVVSDEGGTKDYFELERAPVGAAFIEVVRGAPLGAISIGEGLVIGRDPSCAGRFTVEGVSRKHARLLREPDGTLKVIDLDSRNGTFLNGRKIQVGALRGGDEIRVGPVVLRLRFVGETDRPGASPSADETLQRLRPREREVAVLVAEGLTNAEIGTRLGISTGTVGRHLANIYERLEIHSRAALASIAVAASKS